MLVRLTGKYDKAILRYIEQSRFCTAKQISKIFYKSSSQGEAIARRRLNRMVEAEYLRVYKTKKFNNRNIYIFDTKKNKNLRPSLHDVTILDYQAELIYSGADIIYFRPNQYWMNGTVRSDGFCIFKFNEKIYYNLIEVVVNHNDDNFKKYDMLYPTNEIQNICEGEFPELIIIDSVVHKKDFEFNNDINYKKIDLDLNDFPKIFL
ncbi:hypothetical protein IRP63_14985 (plasmid) [Clostridium botulinum]|uniref:Uncharacterized protein n=1 Tax=Clostridium botulinum C/D str. DC5 TaxID=1443128 RepID=A0A0A0HW31_CLOBO|nr:hypothetical protein [Clostridium botulinum]KEH99886.1 hypothetical protein Z952_p0219 [Clostridium botulinum C/D str. BKT75002]KEI05363.1 hypothetical protein Z954_0219 [Clostridium botulinum C/D str. BKT2873]KGM93389.1 hypothetical protein Z955_15600 [Clostridium botulinum C/D str. DC5]KOC56927.1 hypothetical protein ADU89_01670 [Clostridium botulinum]KOC57402.1 hypothetical protein ADU90_06210 [Clostridium botulinum]